MQKSWREDADKLTFISCLPLSSPSASSTTSTSLDLGQERRKLSSYDEGEDRTFVRPGVDDASEKMLGDVNLFLYDVEDEDEDEDGNETPLQPGSTEPSTSSQNPSFPARISGEIELMIGSKPQQGKGYGRASLLLFLWYISTHLTQILEEFRPSKLNPSRLEYLRVKVHQTNARSIGLFESLGFEKVGDGRSNWFGEVELRMGSGDLHGRFGGDWVGKVLEYAVAEDTPL